MVPADDRRLARVAGFPACHKVAAHQVTRGQVELAKPPVIQLGRGHPGIQAERPERFTLIDVADPSAHALLQQQLAKGGRLRLAGAADDPIKVEWIDQDIRPQVGDRCPGIANQLHHWRGEAHRHDVIETEHRGGAPFRLAPALTRAIEMPRAGHPHVRMEGDPSLELHHEMFTVGLDGLDPATLQSRDCLRARVADHLAPDAPP